MNRALPVYFLAALLIHWAILWAWASMPTLVIGTQEPPSAEIEITEEHIPAEPTSETRVEPPSAKQQPRAEKATEPEAMIDGPFSPPAAQPTPQATPPAKLRPVPPKTRNSLPPKASNGGVGNTAAAPSMVTGTGKDRSHASWKHRITPSYPASALLSRKSGRVLVTVQINALGQATAAAVTTSSANPILDAAAVRAARESTYHPKCLLGVPLPDAVAIPYNFDIRER